MEYTIVHSDLQNSEIKPQELLQEYTRLLQEDISCLLPQNKLAVCGCPTNGEEAFSKEFEKMGMAYRISQTYGNAYVSPRPTCDSLLEFYQKSKAREFWLKDLWPRTHEVRRNKIIHPQLEWVRAFTGQYLEENFLSVAEYMPNHWGYFQEARESGWKWEYDLVRPLFNSEQCLLSDAKNCIHQESKSQSYDCVYLFETLDRTDDPQATMRWVVESLKPGGLCFITATLGSGFEIQVLGEQARAYLPPERLNIFTLEGLKALIGQYADLQIIEFSTPGVLDLPNIAYEIEQNNAAVPDFVRYLVKQRNDENLFAAYQDFLQMNQLSSFGRLVLRKKK